jgi:hypothetical protein
MYVQVRSANTQFGEMTDGSTSQVEMTKGSWGSKPRPWSQKKLLEVQPALVLSFSPTHSCRIFCFFLNTFIDFKNNCGIIALMPKTLPQQGAQMP